jgi:hypothetical protein
MAFGFIFLKLLSEGGSVRGEHIFPVHDGSFNVEEFFLEEHPGSALSLCHFSREGERVSHLIDDFALKPFSSTLALLSLVALAFHLLFIMRKAPQSWSSRRGLLVSSCTCHWRVTSPKPNPPTELYVCIEGALHPTHSCKLLLNSSGDEGCFLLALGCFCQVIFFLSQ